ncbi:hypothetical protein [Lacticaseibacillus daqingensis]|uniref:hypothetical protein n=1 Tax=Lacticaseibacillus daqingensis TaxID=2486014 RepID=UPI000F796FF0|nr:hypothetical protein [Lacticaseibacillus daqingensis]
MTYIKISTSTANIEFRYKTDTPAHEKALLKIVAMLGDDASPASPLDGGILAPLLAPADASPADEAEVVDDIPYQPLSRPTMTPDQVMDAVTSLRKGLARGLAPAPEISHKPIHVDRVKTDLECDQCGFTTITKASYGWRFIRCPQCGNRLRLSAASDLGFGHPDDQGNYYKAHYHLRDDDDAAFERELEAREAQAEEAEA